MLDVCVCVLRGYWTSGSGPVDEASRLGTWLLEEFLEKGVWRIASLPIGCWENERKWSVCGRCRRVPVGVPIWASGL
ncbi:hypothetical protein TNCV_2846891 [Trichonephila clavipes]|nr:hypothetical protein TNCV_2846891 [Trichonephila clavipes]